MTDRLTKFNAEKGEYEYREVAKTQGEFAAQRKAVIQRLGEFEDRAEGQWIICGAFDDFLKCSVCGDDHPWQTAIAYKYCPNCGARMRGNNNGKE